MTEPKGPRLMTTLSDILGFVSSQKRLQYSIESSSLYSLYSPNHPKKCEELNLMSEKYRNEGNEQFKKDNYFFAHHLYTKSIANAVSERLSALAYANRSAALFHMCYYELCIADIRRAISNGYDEKLLYKLLLRQTRCLQLLGKKFEDNLKKVFKAIDENSKPTVKPKLRTLVESEMKKPPPKGLSRAAEYSVGTIPPLSYGASDEVPSFSSAVSVAYNHTLGRHLVAKRDIELGDILIVEKPMATFLHPTYSSVLCHRCFKPGYALIPCNKCRKVMYCCDECLQLDWTMGHKEECEIIGVVLATASPYLQNNFRTLPGLHLTLISRVIGMDKIKEAIVKDENMGLEYNSPRTRGFKDGQFNYSLEALLSLTDNFGQLKDIEFKIFFESVLYEVFIKNSLWEDKKKELFALLMKINLIVRFNYKPITIFTNNSNLSESDAGMAFFWGKEVGYGMYLASSLINHSCDANLHKVNYGTTVVYRACKPIKKGEQLTEFYYHDRNKYGEEKPGSEMKTSLEGELLTEHQLLLKGIWKFTCKCGECISSQRYRTLPNYTNSEMEAIYRSVDFSLSETVNGRPDDEVRRMLFTRSSQLPVEERNVPYTLALFKKICEGGERRQPYYSIKRCIMNTFSAQGSSAISKMASDLFKGKVLLQEVCGFVPDSFEKFRALRAALMANPHPFDFGQ